MQHFIKLINKLVLSAVVLIALNSVTHAQGVHIGGGLIFGTEVEQLGLNGRAVFTLGDWRIAPGIDFFFPENRVTVWSINGDGNYVFEVSGLVKPYLLAGLNFTTVSFRDDDGFFNDNRASRTEVGLNIGGGIDFDLPKVTPFAEFKYTISDFDQAVFTFGVKFGIGK